MLLEDHVIAHDARIIPGFQLIESNLTGRAIFNNKGEQLEILTANRGDLEKMFGVDLIYINTIRKCVVMVQYKMLERKSQDDKGNKDWIYRPDKQFYDEKNRMVLLLSSVKSMDFRLNPNPFYFKFVSRTQGNGSPEGFILHLKHLDSLLESPEVKGPKDGIRISYNILNGRYLRESDFLGLIRSGYIGTHSEDSDNLVALIRSVSEGNKAIVLAWQRLYSRSIQA